MAAIYGALEDHNRDIAKVMLDKLGPTRWQKIVVEAEKLIAARAEKKQLRNFRSRPRRRGAGRPTTSKPR